MKPKLYRVYSKRVPDLYIAERAGSWARWDKKEAAMEMPKEWWEKELSPDWEKELVMEEAK